MKSISDCVARTRLEHGDKPVGPSLRSLAEFFRGRLIDHRTRNGDYLVVASALSEGAVGAYTLHVETPIDVSHPNGRRFAVIGDAIVAFSPRTIRLSPRDAEGKHGNCEGPREGT